MTIQKKLEKVKPYIKTRYFAEELGVFGSFVNGRPRRNSDIDILVSFKGKHKDFFNYMRLKGYLENLFKRKIDLVMKDSIKPRLRNRILKETKYV